MKISNWLGNAQAKNHMNDSTKRCILKHHIYIAKRVVAFYNIKKKSKHDTDRVFIGSSYVLLSSIDLTRGLWWLIAFLPNKYRLKQRVEIKLLNQRKKN